MHVGGDKKLPDPESGREAGWQPKLLLSTCSWLAQLPLAQCHLSRDAMQ